MLRDDELAAWIRLSLAPGLGGPALRQLLAEFGLPTHVLAASRRALAGVVGDAQAARIVAHDAGKAVAAAMHWLESPGCNIVTLADEGYPRRLLEIHDPPSVLYIHGDAALLQRDSLAVVGSRNATAQGRANAENFARTFSQAGITTVSGLALGIDAAAHRGALDGAASTVAVLGSGIDIVYPPRNAELHAAIVARGAVVSEFPLATPPLAHNFPRRNRVISGLSRGVLVVEAAISSGSLITARLAAEQGRDVFAIPGSIHSPVAKGCHALIKDGAKLVESAQDVLAELALVAPPRGRNPPSPENEHSLLQHLGHDPCNVDLLCQRSGLTPETVSAMLLQLELAGLVEGLPGGKYQRVS
jgi:DNA processing protein